MADTLPPGWVGRPNRHWTRVAGYVVDIHALSHNHNADPVVIVGWGWDVMHGESRVAKNTGSMSTPADLCATAPEARRAALTALVSLLTTATREATEALAALEP